MDVISILEKKRQDVTDFDVRVQASGDGTPRVFTRIHLEYQVTGRHVDRAAVERAVELSDTKYCSVSAMLKRAMSIRSVLRSWKRKSVKIAGYGCKAGGLDSSWLAWSDRYRRCRSSADSVPRSGAARYARSNPPGLKARGTCREHPLAVIFSRDMDMGPGGIATFTGGRPMGSPALSWVPTARMVVVSRWR